VTRLLTVEDVAERLGVTKDWVWAQARAGRIPHVQLGRYRRFREEALEEWLDELERRSVDGGLISPVRASRRRGLPALVTREGDSTSRLRSSRTPCSRLSTSITVSISAACAHRQEGCARAARLA
jgi:excisionase family DNA binding protein